MGSVQSQVMTKHESPPWTVSGFTRSRLLNLFFFFFFFNSVWGCWGKSVKSTYCLSSPKEFLKFLLPIFVLRCLSGYVGYHLWQTFLYKCWHFWCFLMGQHHVGSPVERSQQTFWPRGVRGGYGRQWEDDLGPAFLAGVQKAANTVNSFCKGHQATCVTKYFRDESVLQAPRHLIKAVSEHSLWV